MDLTLEILIPGETTRLAGLRTVVFQSAEGEIGVMPGHVPAMVLVESGILRAESRDAVKRFVAGAGVARISADTVSLLVHDLVAEEEIAGEAVRDSLSEAHRALQAAELNGIDAFREDLMRDIRFAEAQLRLLDS